MCYAAFFPFADCVRMTRREWNVWKWVHSRRKEIEYKICRSFYRQTRNFASVQWFKSRAHLAALKYTTRKGKFVWRLQNYGYSEGELLNKLSTLNIMFLRQKKKKTNNQTNTKGHWVLDVMMCNPKDSLHVTNVWARFCKEIIFLTQKWA